LRLKILMLNVSRIEHRPPVVVLLGVGPLAVEDHHPPAIPQPVLARGGGEEQPRAVVASRFVSALPIVAGLDAHGQPAGPPLRIGVGREPFFEPFEGRLAVGDVDLGQATVLQPGPNLPRNVPGHGQRRPREHQDQAAGKKLVARQLAAEKLPNCIHPELHLANSLEILRAPSVRAPSM